MRSKSSSHTDAALYQIKVSGCLADHWSEWFDGLSITTDPEQEETTLAGWVRDQSALHGLLAKIRDLGLPLLCLCRQETSTKPKDDSC
jgi:hypothetical protein